jgi:hypothetical protein
MNSRLHPCKQRDGSARLSAKCKRRHLRTHSKMKELMALAARAWRRSFRIGRTLRLEGLRATGATNARPRLDEAGLHRRTGRRVGHLTSLWGPLRITEGAVTCNGGGKNEGKKCIHPMHASGTYSWKNQGRPEGVLVFEGGVIAPPAGVGSIPYPPASLPAAVRLTGLRIVLPGIDQVQFAVLFARNVERDLVADENRRDLTLRRLEFMSSSTLLVCLARGLGFSLRV